jgi:hypothetical protein
VPPYTAPAPGMFAVTMLFGVENVIACAVGFTNLTVTR